MFVLIILVTQGAFESTGEREFEGHKLGGKSMGCPPCRPDTAFGDWSLRHAVWGVAGHQEVTLSASLGITTSLLVLGYIPLNLDMKYEILVLGGFILRI